MHPGAYRFIDGATQVYLALVGALVLFLHGNAVHSWLTIVAGHAAGIGLIRALLRAHAAHPGSRVLDFLRYFYPLLLLGPFYAETGVLNRMVVPNFLDASFIHFEGWLFGSQPSLDFMDRLPYLAVSEVFYAAYFSYYLMIAGVALALYLRDRAQFAHYVSVVSFMFYVCYLAYILLPVVGPLVLYRDIDGYRLVASARVAAPAFPAAIQSGVFYRLMSWVYRPFESPGASFPSSHVAVAIATVYFSFLYLRRIRWPHLVVAVLLCASTVYCRYHYVIDVAGGVLAAAVLIPLGNRLTKRFGRTAADSGASPAASGREALSTLRQKGGGS